MVRHKILAGSFLFLVTCFFSSFGFAAEAESPVAERGDPMKALYKRVQALEDELDYYKVELEARTALQSEEDEAAEERDRAEEVLRTTEDESAKYVLLKQRTIEMRYSLNYSHSSYDKVTADLLDIERESYYNISNSLGVSYGLLPVLSVSASVPFVYKYQKSGDSNQESSMGDVSFGMSYQLLETSGYIPSTVLSFGYSAPTGKSPYKIDSETELSTGGGTHGFSLGVNFSKTIDPVIAFGAVGFGYATKVTGLSQKRYGALLEEVEPGYSFNYSFGLGFSLSYNTSISFRFSASHSSASRYTINDIIYDSDDSSGASFSIGTGWRISPKTSINISLGYGLIGIEDYSLSVSVPFDFTI